MHFSFVSFHLSRRKEAKFCNSLIKSPTCLPYFCIGFTNRPRKMNSKELQLIIKCGETSTVQFKERFPNQDSIVAEMVAMSNARGRIEEPNIKFINEPVGMQFISVINRIADEGVNEGEGINEEINEGINELESLILTFLKKKPGAKGYEIAEYIQKGAATTERYLKSLKDKELIEYKGSRKTGGYYKK